MNMKTSFIAAAVALATVYSFSVSAVQKDITVTANIDSTLELLQADGSSLPSTMKLDFMPGKGLSINHSRPAFTATIRPSRLM